MKVLEGFYFQEGPPLLVLRYLNLLSEIRELFATWTPSRQIRDFSSEKFSDRELDSWPDSKQYDMDIEPLPTYGHLLVESNHSNVRKTLLWLFATLLCWFRTTKYLLGKCYFFIALIKQAPIIHRILYSFCEICNITKRKSIRKTCIEFYLSLRKSI